MMLTEMAVKDFAGAVASAAPAPGGGSAAALHGALGAALARMVCALTEGRAKYAESAELAAGIARDCERLLEGFLRAVDEDSQAFGQMTSAMALPKGTDEEKAARKEAMQAASKACAGPPLRVMEMALEGAQLCGQAAGRTNSSAASDLGVAALSLKAAAQGAWLNVLINISGLADADFAAEARGKGEAILEKALPAADAAYEAILQSLK
jgi:formiminotetrahydrofolate cyclodeaminase